MESGEIFDSQITASSVFRNKYNFRGLNARLNSDNSWLSGNANHKQWLQVNFKKRASVMEILTQGRGCCSSFVKKYFVSYSNDGVTFKNYTKNKEIKVHDYSYS